MTWLPTVFVPSRIADRPFVCFMDINMPGTNGFEVLRWLRRHDGFASLPVVMLSSTDNSRDLARAAKLGAQCYVTKYPSTSTLSEIVRDAEAYSADSLKSAFEKSYNLLIPRRDSPLGGR